MSNLPSYIPEFAPKATVLDLSGKLDEASIARIEQIASKLSYKAKVVLVPAEFQPTPALDLHDLARSIADHWSVQNNRFLIVIDLPHKQIRTIGGEGLKNKGITTEYLQNTVLPQYFYPSMRQGNLEGAIEQTLQAVQTKQAQYTGASSTNSGAAAAILNSESTSQLPNVATYGSEVSQVARQEHAPPKINGLGLWGTVFIFGSLLVALVLVVLKINWNKTVQLTRSLNDRLGDLYQRADQLGQASEYMDPVKNKDLAIEITAFFEKLTALTKAQDEVEELKKGKNFRGANSGLLNCLRLGDALVDEMDSLLPRVNAITGGVDNTGESEMRLQHKKEQLEKSLNDQAKIPVPQLQGNRYYRPAWSNEPQYAPPVYNNGSSLMDVMFLLNQMNLNNRNYGMNQMDWQQNIPNYRSQSYDNPGISDAGGSWGSSGSNNDAGWGDSGGSDSGGSWDSGSSGGSGGSDAGGSW